MCPMAKTGTKECLTYSKHSWFFKLFEWKLAIANQASFLASLTARFIIAHIFWSSGILNANPELN